MDLQSLLLVLWRKKWILIIVPFFAICCAFAIRFFGDWKYKSSAQLATGLTVSDELISNAKYLNPYEIQVTFNNLIEIINSRSVLGQVSYRLMEHDIADSTVAFRKLDHKKLQDKVAGNLASYTNEFQTILKEKISSLTLLDPNKPEEKRLQIFIEAVGYDYESLLKNIIVYRVNQSDFIEVEFTSENSELSAFVVNTICSEFIRYYSAARANRSNASLNSLEEIAAQRKEYLDTKIEELKNFKSNNDVVNSKVESESKITQIRQYENQIADEQKKLRGLELTIANLTLRIEEAESSSGIRPNDQIVTLRKTINELNEKYIESGQNDSFLLDSLTVLRRKLDAAIRKVDENPKMTTAELNALRNRKEESRIDLEIARENLNSLVNIYNSMRYSIGSFANKEALDNALAKEVEVASEEYQAAQNRLNEAKEKLVTNKGAITQILMAEPAEKAESRKTLIFMIFSGMLSFVISASVIIGIALMDTSIKTAQRFKHQTRLKLAGTLPRMNKNFLNGDVISNAENKLMQKRINEEVRKIRFEIDKLKGRVLLITSLKNTQGKSFFIMALANSLSFQKKRILIIDTNLRNNSLTKLLLAQANLKLLVDNFTKSTKMLGTSQDPNQDNEAFDSNFITKTQNHLIDIIGNKQSQMSPSEVIPGGDFTVLLEWLKSQYDYILLEGPGLNLFSDSKELTEFADLVIPVFSADSSINSEDTEALGYLKSLGNKLGPAVLNNVEQVQ